MLSDDDNETDENDEDNESVDSFWDNVWDLLASGSSLLLGLRSLTNEFLIDFKLLDKDFLGEGVLFFSKLSSALGVSNSELSSELSEVGITDGSAGRGMSLNSVYDCLVLLSCCMPVGQIRDVLLEDGPASGLFASLSLVTEDPMVLGVWITGRSASSSSSKSRFGT